MEQATYDRTRVIFCIRHACFMFSLYVNRDKRFMWLVIICRFSATIQPLYMEDLFQFLTACHKVLFAKFTLLMFGVLLI